MPWLLSGYWVAHEDRALAPLGWVPIPQARLPGSLPWPLSRKFPTGQGSSL